MAARRSLRLEVQYLEAEPESRMAILLRVSRNFSSALRDLRSRRLLDEWPAEARPRAASRDGVRLRCDETFARSDGGDNE